ncbi:hypothetical protein ALC57_13813 [Trachymyrmex cornetzi]|uniref:Uncharacterized protein n=1 Tax=Trachymyrmex cornetzi TaxID=471704 RepID=A0A151IZ07_9HYME|nr:hypothetical protein ALC57_13813 [Trachymyrmex cornetzi]
MSATVQPYIIVIGNVENSITAAYVCINSTLWKVGSVLQAVDICFKSFFTFDAEYQIEAYHIWLFIQRALYDIYLVGERSVTNVTTLISRLNQIAL